MRKNEGEQYFLNGIFAVAAALSLINLVISEGYRNIEWQYVPYVYGASLFYTLYQVYANKAYQTGGNISTHYPLTVLSPLFIPIWAFFVLGEKISVISAAGILVTVSGAVIMQLKSFSLSELAKIFRFSKDYKGARYAITASFMYSFGAIFDKFKIAHFSVSAYLAIIICFMALNMIIYLWLTGRRDFVSGGFMNYKLTFTGGFALLFSFLFFRIALAKTDVSIAVPVRQTSIIFAILFGVILLKEKFSIQKIAAVTVIFAGMLLINFGLR